MLDKGNVLISFDHEASPGLRFQPGDALNTW
ncbi:hypothetical protein Spb1_05040 [Planctopirus ephydatiae]|jgi:hypothetical protein|uniref:Uncharacterized protein n=1 Tax=Planctopirus ephydatiae TaxID=2528019 RepID=A0A518GJB0_9PLAN|nr:hypothetical protein Spb1_05040 [Planctopirus ephydatiae]